ncbi:MAG: PepSY domain-containing protein [Pseudomonadota bacterium]
MTALSARADSDDIDMSAVELDVAAATAIALDTVPGTVVEAELEDEDGVVVREREVVGDGGQTRELSIDAATGAVLENELDD